VTLQTPAENKPDLASFSALVTVFALVIGFTYSDDTVEFAMDLADKPYRPVGPWLVFVLDLVLVSATAVLKWRISGRKNSPAAFLRQLFTGWWGLGAALVIGAHLFLITSARHREDLGDTATVWISLAVSSVFVTAMAALLMSALGQGAGSRSWLVPLVIGTFAVDIASALWYPVINLKSGCANDISPNYFSDAINLTSIVVLALGLELNFVRRNAASRDLGQRVVPVFTVVMLCVALALAFSMLVKADLEPLCGVGAVWHEYISFVVTTHALAIGLSTLVWLMVIDASES
jgi:hypothetical protein